jgi:hypothetical protein
MTITLAILTFGITTINDVQVIAFQLVDPYFGRDVVYMEINQPEMEFSVGSQPRNYNDDVSEFPHVVFQIRGIIETEDGIKLLPLNKQ